MNFWHQVPFARLLLPLIAGILCSVFELFPVSVVFAGCVLLFFCYLVLFFFLQKNINRMFQRVSGIFILVLFLGMGYLMHNRYHQLNDASHFSYSPSIYKTIQLCEAPVLKARSVKVVTKVKGVYAGNQWKASDGKLMVYLQRDSVSEQLRYGDVLLLKAKEQEVKPPHNPGEFNYKRYLLFNNIFHQAYARGQSYTIIKRGEGNEVFAMAYQIRNRLVTLFKARVKGTQEAAVSTALVFGYVDELDPDLIQSYSNTGTLHVLAVSGMHVGIIFVVLNWMLRFMDKNRRTAVLKAILIGLFLWTYSLVAGLSPSILRAATMFSFITIGQLLRRRSSIYNTLAASAFLMILFKPTIMAGVGFQLSYAAVIGIVFIQPKMYRLLRFRSYLGDLTWKVTTVSVAAQVATFPMGLLYFHQFPNYFIFSNLIIIPLTTLILYIGLALIVVSAWEPVATFIGNIIFYGIKFTNWLVEKIDELPYATINGISISIVEACLIYIFLALLSAFLLTKKAWQLKLMLGVVFTLLVINGYERYQQANQRELTVYHVPGHSAIAQFNGTHAVLMTDSLLSKNESALRFYILHHWWQMGVDELKISPRPVVHPCMIQTFGNQRVLFINGKQPWEQLPATDVAMVVLSNNPFVDMEKLKQRFNPEQLIFDSSNKPRKTDFLKRLAANYQIKVYDVTQQGAFRLIK